MEEISKITLQPFTAEVFHLYGQVLQLKHLIYPETEEGRVAMEMLRLPYYPQAKRMTQLAIHFSYNQTFIPLEKVLNNTRGGYRRFLATKEGGYDT